MVEEPASAAIDLEGVAKRFSGRPALTEVTFSVPAGEVFGLVGSNGAGKTTMLRIVATLEPVDEGHVSVNGTALNQDPDGVRAALGYLPDFFGLYEHLNPREHLEFYAGIRGIPRPRRRQLAKELLEFVGMAEHGDDDVTTLSRGQRQRLGLGQALVHDPPVLLLDEPASGLDPLGQVEMREVINELQVAGKTVVVSSHDLAALADMCTWIGVLEAGRMRLVRPMSEVRITASDRRLCVELDGDGASELAAAASLARQLTGVVDAAVLGHHLEVAMDERCATHDLVAHLVCHGAKVRSVCPIDGDVPTVLAGLMGGPRA